MDITITPAGIVVFSLIGAALVGIGSWKLVSYFKRRSKSKA
jgi:hypothetical protein